MSFIYKMIDKYLSGDQTDRLATMRKWSHAVGCVDAGRGKNAHI